MDGQLLVSFRVRANSNTGRPRGKDAGIYHFRFQQPFPRPTKKKKKKQTTRNGGNLNSIFPFPIISRLQFIAWCACSLVIDFMLIRRRRRLCIIYYARLGKISIIFIVGILCAWLNGALWSLLFSDVTSRNFFLSSLFSQRKISRQVTTTTHNVLVEP